MKIQFVEIQNFRKLRSTHIDFDNQTTLFVGANNSGKTSAMLALRYFLVSPNKLSIRDITITNWTKLDSIGQAWEAGEESSESITSLLPALDVWLDVPLSQIHHVVHILPTLDWSGGLVGVRLQYEPDTLERLQEDYRRERKAALDAVLAHKGNAESEPPQIWPGSLTEFLAKRLSRYLDIKAYALDVERRELPEKGAAKPQALSEGAIPLDKNPFKSLIRIDEIAAQREFADAGDRGTGAGNHDKSDGGSPRFRRRLSDQLRSYYDRHLDPAKTPSAEDLEALGAIQHAERNFDTRLETGFADAFEELEDLGYPGISNPRLKLNTRLRATDGLKHGSAVEYEVANPSVDGLSPLRLPEDYSGLGYQNLISMVFMLMSFRDEWMRVGKATSAGETAHVDESIQPLHLVLVEEPEAHLHAQVQQVFIKKAYALLRRHTDLDDSDIYSTQLVVSTHSSHVAHEADFSNLRYFRRHRADSKSEVPTTTVANLSHTFGHGDKTQRFVKRYLKATHCDIFFADGVIFVEGQAERILLPHFIRHHFNSLSRRYVTLLDLGGSHAHRFKRLVDELGLTILIIADLDATKAVKVNTKSGSEVTRWIAAKPERRQGQKTSNAVLKDWHPTFELIDDLLALDAKQHAALIDGDYDLYVAFQKPVSYKTGDTSAEDVIPRTFEDAIVYTNAQVLKEEISGSATSRKVKDIVSENLDGDALADELFGLLKNAEKAAFALDCLLIDDPKSLLPPPYIRDGLSWLECKLEEKTYDAMALAKSS